MLLLIVPGLVLAIWSAGVLLTTDIAVPVGSIASFRKVLAVFPHADDETVNCGGTIHRLSAAGSAVTLLLLTSGERGNPGGVPDRTLKAIRAQEARHAAAILGIRRLIQQDFGDGQLTDRKEEVMEYLAGAIRRIAPDLILTYDLAGLDGHPDHVACAEMLTELHGTHFPTTSLWYVALPSTVLRLLKAAGQLRTDARVDRRRASPTVRIFIGMGVLPKIRAWYAYRSQRGFIAKGLGKLVPTWFAVSTLQFECFAEVI